MGKKEKRDSRVRSNPKNVRFEDALLWLYDQGFILERISGSHRILRHPQNRAKLNFQPAKDGKAKAYQIKQAIYIIRSLD